MPIRQGKTVERNEHQDGGGGDKTARVIDYLTGPTSFFAHPTRRVRADLATNKSQFPASAMDLSPVLVLQVT
jgi:hypothetical protein